MSLLRIQTVLWQCLTYETVAEVYKATKNSGSTWPPKLRVPQLIRARVFRRHLLVTKIGISTIHRLRYPRIGIMDDQVTQAQLVLKDTTIVMEVNKPLASMVTVYDTIPSAQRGDMGIPSLNVQNSKEAGAEE